MARFLFVLVAIAGLSACASTPDNFGEPSVASRIGVIHLVDDHPKYFHIGTTISDNFESPVASMTDFRSRFMASTSEVLTQAGYAPQNYAPTKVLFENRFDLLNDQSKVVEFNPVIETELNRIAASASLDFVIVVYPLSGPAWAEAATYIDGYGLYTECLLNNCSAKSVSYVDARIYDVQNQAALKGSAFKLYEKVEMPGVVFSGDPRSMDAHTVDAAADIAVDSFDGHFEGMLRTALFIQ